VDFNYACVMENPTQEVSLNSLTFATVVECPANSLIIENFNIDKMPNYSTTAYPYDLYDLT
jgi:hypothetical protein